MNKEIKFYKKELSSLKELINAGKGDGYTENAIRNYSRLLTIEIAVKALKEIQYAGHSVICNNIAAEAIETIEGI